VPTAHSQNVTLDPVDAQHQRADVDAEQALSGQAGRSGNPPLSQLEVLREVTRTGVRTPAELAARMHVRVQSLTDSINELVARGLVSAAGLELLDRDRAARDAWLHATMHDNLTPPEVDLLMLVAPVLRKLANEGAAP
jgi:MarR family